MALTLIRVIYGNKNTKPEDKEYQINGTGAAGTLKQYRKMFPCENFICEERQ